MDNLPVEVLLKVVEFCPLNDVARLCLTAKYLYTNCNPVLYRNVDLSIHNRGRVKIRPTDGYTQASDSYWCTQVPADFLLRQESFITAILGKPGLALLVRSLTWTLLRPHTKELNQSLPLGITQPRAMLRIWDAFQCLTDVRTLDLAWLSRDHGDPLADGFYNGLFPAATSIRLSGVMHYSFAASILCNNPAKLENLTLDNLQQVGNRCDHFLYRLANQRQDYLQSPSTWNQMVHQYGSTTPFGPAGPMQNILGPLAGRCPNLRTLTLRKVGQWRRTEFTPEFAAKDEDIYREFAFFVNSVKGTLRHFVFEQGRRAVPPPLLPAPAAPAAPAAAVAGQIATVMRPRPKNTRFFTLLYPHLQDHWQCLESMTLGGVYTNWPGASCIIRTSHGSTITAVNQKNVTEMDHIGLGDPLAGVIR